jgi:hypothetical protein
MLTAPSVIRLTAWALLCCVLAGCGDGTPPPTPVQGKVLYRGVPLAGATIVFTPDASRGGNGRLGRAQAQADGTYSVENDSDPNPMTGWYRVTVLAVQMPSLAGAGQRVAVPYSLVPAKYCDPDLSGLSCEIKPGRENEVNFNLE